jgi:hypothetical protein
MRKFIFTIALPFLIIFAIVSTAGAQEMKAKKLDNPQWKTITFVKFKSGKLDRAKEIIRNYYEKAAVKAATSDPTMAIDLMTGEWDMMIVWSLKGGLDDLNWEVSPENVKWMAALTELAGGGDKAKAILDEFAGLVDRENN